LGKSANRSSDQGGQKSGHPTRSNSVVYIGMIHIP
jgi:hypothetical protein